MNFAVALGALAGTAVLTGALLVGDSVRGSLRHLTLDRLGRVDEALVADHFFSAELATSLTAAPEFAADFDCVVPAILLQGSVSNPDKGNRGNRVSLIGCDAAFWELGEGGPARLPAAGEVVLNRRLADELDVAAGDDVIVRLPLAGDIPPDSPLGKKSGTIANRRLKVSDVIPANPDAPTEGLARFGLVPNQQTPANLYLNLADVQAALDQKDRINALLVAGRDAATPPSEDDEKKLSAWLTPKLSDYGISLALVDRGHINLTSDRMLLPMPVEAAAARLYPNDERPQPVLTYLANYILAGNGAAKVPYSTITAIDFAGEPPLGPFTTPQGETIAALADDEIVLNRWTFDDLAKQGVTLEPGDEVQITYFEPESTHGRIVEKTTAFKFKAACALEGAAADRDFTPELKGVTDKKSLANWSPPFPYFPERVRTTPPNNQDDLYWNKYRATPKAFVSLAAGRKLWSSRFGQTTSLRFVPRDGLTVPELAQRLESELAQHSAELGFAFQPVKRQGLTASEGTTDFKGLFIGFSFFIIAAAVMLVALLFRLGVERRAGEVGTLLAVGWPVRSVRRLLLGEGLLVASLGSAAGVAAGVAYAWLMLAGLRTPGWWLAAVSSPFLNLYFGRWSLVIGYVSGVAVSAGAIAWALRAMRHVSVRQLLNDQLSEEGVAVRGPSIVGRLTVWSSLVLAVVAGGLAQGLSGEAQAGAFFGSGALVLTALLTFLRARLRSGETGQLIKPGGHALARLALRNAARNPGRSTLSIGLIASASFLIVAISAFRLEPPENTARRASGSGGFMFWAESEQPIVGDVNSAEGRADLGFSGESEKVLAGHEIVPLRVKPGDDASCLNLYQPRQPRLLGVSEALVRRGGFAWGATTAKTPEEQSDPLLLLDKSIAGDSTHVVPAVLDANTATYSLHKALGDRYEIADGRGGTLVLEIVGLLKNSIFQGDLLISEAEFLATFPDVSGYRAFLIDAGDGDAHEVEQTMEETLGDYGFDAVSTRRRLADFMAVQNTYLSTFQSLGALGLLLGTFGLAVVQLRNVLERRGELALLRATGFRRALLARLVTLENVLLLAGGLGVGVLAALVAVLPHFAAGGASLPVASLAVTLGVVLGVGLLVGLIAVRATLSTPLLPALRGE
jgi:ABC-type antimicrobial peptide transport system permease subunit